MFIPDVKDLSIHGAKKSSPSPLFVMRTVAAAIIPEEGPVPSLYRTKTEHEQLEHLNTVNDIGGIVKNCAFFSFYYIIIPLKTT